MAEDADLIRRAIPGYELLRPIGRGGMGVAYLARQLSLGRRVVDQVPESGPRSRPGRASRPLPPRGGADGAAFPIRTSRRSLTTGSMTASPTWSWSTSRGVISGANSSRENRWVSSHPATAPPPGSGAGVPASAWHPAP